MFRSTTLINNAYITALVVCTALALVSTPTITQLGFVLATA